MREFCLPTFSAASEYKLDMKIVSPQEILEFWYADDMRPRWFDSTPQLDAEIRRRFESVWEAAAAGQLDLWLGSPDGCLALAIVLDQFPLNMFRGTARSFATERQAIDVANLAVAQGFDRQLERSRLAFLYMPLMHSENLMDQDASVALFHAAGLQENARFAEGHREIVRRFGRFPHRNAILGRKSTADELSYLESPEAFQG